MKSSDSMLVSFFTFRDMKWFIGIFKLVGLNSTSFYTDSRVSIFNSNNSFLKSVYP
jgi:hypothetical protein